MVDMKRFSFSDMNRSSGEILETALVEPVALTKYGKEKLVILTAETYQRLAGKPQVQAFGLYDAPDEVHQDLLSGLDEILAEGDADA